VQKGGVFWVANLIRVGFYEEEGKEMYEIKA
jgi:hypothetical protein